MTTRKTPKMEWKQKQWVILFCCCLDATLNGHGWHTYIINIHNNVPHLFVSRERGTRHGCVNHLTSAPGHSQQICYFRFTVCSLLLKLLQQQHVCVGESVMLRPFLLVFYFTSFYYFDYSPFSFWFWRNPIRGFWFLTISLSPNMFFCSFFYY